MKKYTFEAWKNDKIDYKIFGQTKREAADKIKLDL